MSETPAKETTESNNIVDFKAKLKKPKTLDNQTDNNQQSNNKSADKPDEPQVDFKVKIDLCHFELCRLIISYILGPAKKSFWQQACCDCISHISGKGIEEWSELFQANRS